MMGLVRPESSHHIKAPEARIDRCATMDSCCSAHNATLMCPRLTSEARVKRGTMIPMHGDPCGLVWRTVQVCRVEYEPSDAKRTK